MIRSHSAAFAPPTASPFAAQNSFSFATVTLSRSFAAASSLKSMSASVCPSPEPSLPAPPAPAPLLFAPDGRYYRDAPTEAAPTVRWDSTMTVTTAQPPVAVNE